MTYQIIIDCMMFIDIVFLCLITYVNDHGEWETNLWSIFKNYAKQQFIWDSLATIPCLVTGQSKKQYLWKLIRAKEVKNVLGTIEAICVGVLNRSGIYKGSIGKIVFSIMLVIYLASACHFIGCAWICVAKLTECSWLKQGHSDEPGCQKGPTVDTSENSTVYITAIYWVITTLTTVGYGDYKGYTPTEYAF